MWKKVDYPITLEEAIRNEEEFLSGRFPNLADQIGSYAFEVSMAVNETLANETEMPLETLMDSLCQKLETVDRLGKDGIPPNAHRYVIAIRKMIRQQIMEGKVIIIPTPHSCHGMPMGLSQADPNKKPENPTWKACNRPASLNDVLVPLKEDLMKRYPDQKGEIASFAESVPKVITGFLETGKGIDEICAFFINLEKLYLSKMHPKIRDEIRSLRIQIGEQIRLGKIALPEIKK